MFRFLKKEKGKRYKNNIKLVSIHIPKTAGTSFRNTLKDAYGLDKVKRLDLDKNKFALEQEPFESDRLTKNIEVVHGHMVYEMLFEKFEISTDTPVITWLRDPVSRVISNYKYLSKRLAEELDEKGKGLNILSKMQRTLLEYAHDEENQNRMSKFLAGIDVEDLFFVGITEYYSEDLNDLGHILDWKNTEEFRVNVTGKKIDDVSDEDKDIIRKLNMEDDKLYKKALELRMKRKSEIND